MKWSNHIISLSCLMGVITLPSHAQNLVDATRFSNNDIMGTARYRSMAGAFGALGGDPSAMHDNPAGIGIYRGTNEISITPNLSIARTTTEGSINSKEKERDFFIGNLSYIVSFKPQNTEHLVNLNFGIGFNHSDGSTRRYSMVLDNPRSSFGAYLANLTNNALVSTGRYNNPGYLSSDAGWQDPQMPLLGLMAYDCYAIDDVRDGLGNSLNSGVASYDQVQGLPAYQRLNVIEENRTDEYNFNVSANWDDFVYAGLTLSIVDFNSTIQSEFNEDYDYSYQGDYTQYFNNLETKGTGVNLKFGAIIKPLEAWRIGIAVHTPTWYEMDDIYEGGMITNDPNVKDYSTSGDLPYEYSYRFYSPWKYQFSTAYIFGTRAILSFEYDMTDFRSMKYKEGRDEWSSGIFDAANQSIKDNMTEQHTFKAGAEFRATPRLSLRLGYAYQSSPYQDEVYDATIRRGGSDQYGNWWEDNELMFGSSTKPNYTMLDDTQFITGGVGWRGKNWYIDLACVHRTQNEKISAFPTSDALMGFDNDNNAIMSSRPHDGAVTATYVDMKTKTLSWDLTLGFKF